LARCLSAAAVTRRSAQDKTAKAIFAGGCFWCVEADFDKVPGVISTTSGYINGTVKNPTYKQVSAGGTGHAEAVEIVYDPAKVTYAKLLDVFWRNIDPLVKDKQFCDSATCIARRSSISTTSRRSSRRRPRRRCRRKFAPRAVYTEIVKADTFYKAEEYHQDYYKKNEARYNFLPLELRPRSASRAALGQEGVLVMTRRAMLLGTAGRLRCFSLQMGPSSDAAPAAKVRDREERRGMAASASRSAQYDVAAQARTDAHSPARSTKEKRKGTFACAGCDLPLFSSDTKFDSRTGWPSFWQPLPNAIGTSVDRSFLMSRTEVQLPPLRRASRSRVRGRSEADRACVTA
jgi:methionine-S-sulfoxide reductase